MSETKTTQSELENERETSARGPWDFLGGLLVGGLAGAGAMLMLAPQSGRRSRAKIQQKSIVLRDQASEAVEDVLDQARAKVHQVKVDVRKDTKKLQHRGKEILDDQMERLSTAVDGKKEAILDS